MKSELKNIEKIRMYKIIAQELMDFIVNNNLQSGDSLPAEIELSNLFNVSRSSVREGLLHLETLGIVTTNHRGGVIVNDPNFKMVSDQLIFGFKKEMISRKDLVDVRKMMEIGALSLALPHLNETHFAKMKQSIESAKVKLEQNASGLEEDLVFHQTILQASNNIIVENFCGVLREFFHYKTHKYNFEIDSKTIKDHEEICNHLENKRLQDAEEAMKRHFEPLYSNDYTLQLNSNIYIYRS